MKLKSLLSILNTDEIRIYSKCGRKIGLLVYEGTGSDDEIKIFMDRIVKDVTPTHNAVEISLTGNN